MRNLFCENRTVTRERWTQHEKGYAVLALSILLKNHMQSKNNNDEKTRSDRLPSSVFTVSFSQHCQHNTAKTRCEMCFGKTWCRRGISNRHGSKKPSGRRFGGSLGRDLQLHARMIIPFSPGTCALRC